MPKSPRAISTAEIGGTAAAGGANGQPAIRRNSALMRELRRERELAEAQLTPAERLREALELSEFCLKLAAKGRELRAISSPPKNLKRS